MLEVMVALVELVVVKAGILVPEPLAASPMEGSLLVHEKTVLDTDPARGIAVVVIPLQCILLVTELTVGAGFTVTVTKIDGPLHPFALGVMV